MKYQHLSLEKPTSGFPFIMWAAAKIWKFAAASLLILATMSGQVATAAGTWTALVNQAPGGIGAMLLLSDGTVMCQSGVSWFRLTPDINGNYVNGTWTTLAPMHDSRTYYSSQVLRDGRVFVAGGEYGTGATRAEIYDPIANAWTQAATPPDTIIDNISATLPNGNVLEGFPGQDCRIYNIVSNTWSAKINILGGQDEAEWVKLQDGSILTIDPFGTNTERYVPALNQWVRDVPVTTPMYGYGGELGPGFLLPNGKVIFIGGTSHTSIYTPWTTNAAGIYTPAGATNAGTWVAGPDIPNFNAAVDAPGAMMNNGKILCCMADTNNSYGNGAYYYEYDYISNAFTQVNAPTGGLHASPVAYAQQMLDLPDGTVLLSGGFGAQAYVYKPTGSQITNGVPTILSVTTNLDGSYHITGTLFNGISDGAAYGDDKQMSTAYPIARMTNSSGNVLYCRSYNWSTCDVMTGTNVVSTEMTLPYGLLAGTYPLFVTANGFSSGAYPLAISGTPLPPVVGLGFTTVSSNNIVFHWSRIGLTETGYVIQRSTDGTNYSTLAVLGSTTTNYTDNAVTPLGQYYYRVLGTNSVGLGLAAPVILAASKSVTPLPAPWQSQDVGAVLGRGASGANAGVFTVIGSGAGIRLDNDQFQFVYQPIAGDATITARVLANQNTGTNAMAGVMIRSSLGFDVADALLVFDGGAQSSIFEHRAAAADLALYGLKIYGESFKNDAPKPPGGSSGSSTVVSQPASAPLWVRLVRSGNTITSYRSTDGSTWTPQGSNTVAMPAIVYVGLAVTSGNFDQLNTSTFDNVTVTGLPAAIPPPMAEWKLDETSGTIANDSIDSFDGLYNNVTLGQPGATPVTGYSAGFNGASSSVSIPALNLNSNALTITAWVNRNGSQSAWSGIFFNRANSTVAGVHFGTANELRYTWNNNASTYNWNSGLVAPNNQWAFVALIVEPTRARLFLGTNGVLVAATNNVANPVQAFDAGSYIGQDPLGGRFVNGLLDDVRLFNQVLTPAQLSQIASTPVVAFSTPVNGQEFLPPATVNLAANLSATTGHTINLVELFNGADLISESAVPPYTNTVSGLPAGTYTFSARLYYDSGLEVDSDPANVIVESGPASPQNVLASILSSSEVYVSWQPSAGADGYILSRNGSPIATFGTTTNYFVDTGLAINTTYCYIVTATNQVGTANSASSCVTMPATAATLTWDAGSSGGPQDGNGTWNTTATNWWNGSVDVAWTNNCLAVFGAGGATNSLVGLAATVAPVGIIFNASSGGTYTISNASGGITLTGTNVVYANANATINAALSGSGKLVKAGNNTLTLPAANSQSGGIIVNAGMIITQAPNGSAYGSTGNGNLVVNFGGVAEANGDNSLVGQTTSGSKTITINAGGMVTNTGTTSCHLNAVVLNGGTLAATSANGTYANWNFDHGVSTPGGGKVSIIAGGNATVSQTGGSVFSIGANDTVTVSTVLDHVSGITDTGLIKIGTGTLALSAVNNYTSATTVSAGTLQVDGSLAGGAVTVQNTATLAGSGTVNGATTVASGGTLAPGDAGIGTLSFGSNLTLNPGAKTVLELGKFFGTLNNDVIFAAGTLALNGSLTVANIGTDALAAGDSFIPLNGGTFSGNFSTVTLPALPSGLVWDSSQLAHTGVITVVSLTPLISSVAVSGTGGFTVGGSGAAGQPYVLLSTANLAPPITWLPVQTNIADTNGIFSLTDLQATNSPQGFYRVMAQ